MVSGQERWAALLRIDSSLATGLNVEDASPDVSVFAPTDLAFAIKIPSRLRQRLQYVRSLLPQDIVHMM